MLNEIIVALPFMPIAILGMLIHFVKTKVKSGGTVSWSDYWLVNRDKTLLAFLSVIGAVYITFTAGQLNAAAAFFIGYAGDSILNKWDRKISEENKI